MGSILGTLIYLGIWLIIPVLCLSLIAGVCLGRRSPYYGTALLLAFVGGAAGMFGAFIMPGGRTTSHDLPTLYFSVIAGFAGFLFGGIAGILTGRIAGRNRSLLPTLIAVLTVIVVAFGAPFLFCL